MQTIQKDENKDLAIRKTIGREHLYANRIEDALAVFAGILRDYPEDVESLVILGDLYLASGDSSTSVQLYSRAMQQKKEDVQIERRLHLAQVEKETSQETPETVPNHPEAVARLLHRLTGKSNPITETEISRATELFDSVLKASNPSQQVAEYLDEIDVLIPAYLELNIRQARSDGRYAIVESLEKIRADFHLHLDAPDSIFLPPPKSNGKSSLEKPKVKISGRIIILVPGQNLLSNRVELMREGLKSMGGEIVIANEALDLTKKKPEVVIAINPHAHSKIMNSLAACAAADIPIILDMDTNYELMPPEHPDYNSYGIGTPAITRAYTSALLLANLITVPNQVLAQSLKRNGFPTMVIPDGWSENNPHWSDYPSRKKRKHIGWIGQPGQFEDVAQIRRVIVRVLREFPDSQLVVVGDQHVYHLFESIPGNRRRYLPMPPIEEYPHLLDQIDILLVPFRDTPFNNTQSDKLLVEANVKGIPWVASPIPAFIEWEAGGLIADSPDDWHKKLRQLIMDYDFRQKLINNGKQRAQTRELNHLKHAWYKAIKSVQEKTPIFSLQENTTDL